MKTTALCMAIVCVAWLGCSRLSDDHGSATLIKCSVCHELPPQGVIHAVHSAEQSFDCSVCHEGYARGVAATNGASHDNGTVDVEFSRDFDSLGTGTFDGAAKSCNVYCHGYFPQGDSAAVLETDTVDMRCDACHNLAKMRSVGHYGHTTSATINTVLFLNENCGFCHPGNNLLTGIVNDSTHCDGRKGQSYNCTRCPHR